MKQDKVLEKIGNIIKENFPFYVSYNLDLKDGYYCEISVIYYYMGKEVKISQVIPINDLEREYFLTGLKDFLLDVRKDLISYPECETQQEFFKKCDLMHCPDCKFINNHDCRHKQVKWLYEEYTALTDAEINLINTLSEMTGVTYNFIVRDKFNEIKLYHKIPIAKVDEYGKRYLDQRDYMRILDRTKKLFPSIQYRDGIYDITEECFLEE